jgi:hypothetical protein
MTYKKSPKNMLSAGSALILAVVLTSLLAIIGVMFVMIARVDKMATSAISENKELNSAVETVVAKISQELVLDVPGVAGAEYYDYPGDGDKWLASLEPYKDGTDYKWRQISDVYNKLGLSLELPAEIIPDYQEPSYVGDSNSITDYPADADGDGVADSNWVIIPDMTSNKGKPIYAAIRIIDNGGMINVNTAYKFDPNVGPADANLIDGSSQMQLNLEGLARGGDLIGTINQARGLSANPSDVELTAYENAVIWRTEDPCKDYLPFDISDELILRNRYLIDQDDTVTRLKAVWPGTFDRQGAYGKNFPYASGSDLPAWFDKAYRHLSDANTQAYYNLSHISTIHNIDRIIDPNGNKIVNINDPNVSIGSLYSAIRAGLYDADPNFAGVNGVAAQIAVNLKDFRDSDSNITSISVGGSAYYGFERPCIYISELVHRFVEVPNPIPGEPNIIYRSYAVELYKPYPGDNNPDPNWQIVIKNPDKTASINWSGTGQYHVIRWQNTNAQLDVNGTPQEEGNPTSEIIFDVNSTISLTRKVGSVDVIVDSKVVPGGWLITDGNSHSIQRDIQPHKCIRRLWDSVAKASDLGGNNKYKTTDPNWIQAHPANAPFTNVGEIGMLFRKGAYYIDAADRPDRIGYGTNKTEEEVRLNLADPAFQQLFKYLTVFDPCDHITDPNKLKGNETKIKGRININTAPWYVIAQLPWMQYEDGTPFERAKAISNYRDNTLHGFKNIGELMLVNEMQNLGSDNKDNLNTDTPKGPDLTADNAKDDFEERDVIFARISNLVTVRSDVFTAYILVRIGADGPQKRVMAILDRSNVYSGDGKVRIVALHLVPDPR